MLVSRFDLKMLPFLTHRYTPSHNAQITWRQLEQYLFPRLRDVWKNMPFRQATSIDATRNVFLRTVSEIPIVARYAIVDFVCKVFIKYQKPRPSEVAKVSTSACRQGSMQRYHIKVVLLDVDSLRRVHLHIREETSAIPRLPTEWKR